MNIFKRKSGTNRRPTAATVQTARNKPQPFLDLERYIPLASPEQEMYDSLREAVPIIDAALDKIVRLVGGFTVNCNNPAAKKMLNDFLNDVKVGAGNRGIDSFLSQYLNRLLTWGTAVAEIVPYTTGSIAALYCANNKNLELLKGEGPLDVKVCTRVGGELIPVKNQERVLLSALNPMPGEVLGNSLLKGLPFVSSVLLKIYNSVGVNFERIGNLRYAVTYKPSGSMLENSLGADTVSEISEEWSRAMNSADGVRDFVAVGDVDVKVIGADNQVLDSEIPARQMLEQIIAKLGIPPFMLGLCWSSTERMSQQQADILTSELESYRKLLNPVIRKICRWQLQSSGYACDFSVDWEDINLQDEVEQSRAALLKAQAESTGKGESKK